MRKINSVIISMTAIVLLFLLILLRSLRQGNSWRMIASGSCLVAFLVMMILVLVARKKTRNR